MVKLVDTADSKSAASRRAGSIPALGTKYYKHKATLKVISPYNSRTYGFFYVYRIRAVVETSSSSHDTLFNKATKSCWMVGLTFQHSCRLAATRLSKKLDILALARMGGWRT